MAGVGDGGGLAGGPTLGGLCAIEPLFDTSWFTGIFFLFFSIFFGRAARLAGYYFLE